MMAVARCTVANTSTGPNTLGSTWRNMITGDATPITRAACTYSRFFSTSVEPRTVRAYCGQPASAMAPISTGNAISSCISRGTAARATPSISNAIRIAGKDSCTSAIRMMNASMRPPA
ncbi:hypothetical protein G6F24_018068 [Rhizopus arrhizus]|nr:hypothetical protein G6F24_018068 [Rhizopus arrhizus]